MTARVGAAIEEAMPSYRLLAGQGTVVETFEVADDEEARRRGRELSIGYERPGRRWGTRYDLRVERQSGAHWVCVFAWVPAR